MPEFAYYAINHGRMGRSNGKCRLIARISQPRTVIERSNSGGMATRAGDRCGGDLCTCAGLARVRQLCEAIFRY